MNACHKRLLTPLAGGLISLLLAHPAAAKLFVPKLEPWPLWTASSEDNRSTIDHAELQLLLDTYLITDAADGINRFDYRSVTETDRRGLQNYIGNLTALEWPLFDDSLRSMAFELPHKRSIAGYKRAKCDFFDEIGYDF